ncbi:MAG: DNA repair protein RecN, partial [Planktomarina sp.]
LSAAEKELNERKTQIETVAAEEEFLRHAVAELDALSPELGEEATLDARRRMMQAAERIQDDVAKAHNTLAGAESNLGDANRWIEGASAQVDGGLEPALSALGDAMMTLGEAQSQVEYFLNALQFDAHELEAAEERLFAIRAQARKYAVAPDELAAHAAFLRDKLDALDQGTAGLAKLEKALGKANVDYAAAAAKLTKSRQAGGIDLDAAMSAELAPLKMERAVFETRVTDAAAGPNGVDEVSFTVATNPGAPAGPLNKIASGGELSRFLLALKVCLSKDAVHRTMIFDEIDRGVGGATADAVGRRLKALGAQGQVLVVTHSPQVAALGAAHWRVEKHATDTVTTSIVVPLSDDMRVEEIARMVSGDIVTDAAKEAARALLAG